MMVAVFAAGLALAATAAYTTEGRVPVRRAGMEQEKEQGGMRIIVTSVFVDDQDKALDFYTNVLGFVKKQDFPVGRFKWLTVVSPSDNEGVELLLEPNDNPAARTFQKAVFEQGIPATTFGVNDLEREYERLQKLGVVFRGKPTRTGPVLTAVLEDTCGNLIQLAQK
jgi:catechol 2,3-dioxygenase-like lactoylglutathione lyase family enzyme